MNAKSQVARMKETLINAGFVMEIVEESDTKNVYFFTQAETQWFETRKTFFIAASKSEYSNNWRKYLSFTKSGFGDNSVDKSNMTYADMWSEINVVKYNADYAKAGA